MADNSGNTAGVISHLVMGRWCLVPFTSGLVFFLYAFFWPESYGHWLGTIVRAFRTAAGF